ncbi:LysM domain-containing protein [Promicromonospora umidemergens]|uniref:LysM domain-containing protein n=1 Tax=Promicromonospora umidemergens TaxID=629679 RepID=A0ABP8XPF0_9MICO|nr:LysM peptidoglycan-binding domain-containing protein [Promicromonospora umidemergens]MCP2285431.1 LysM domain-containing protein [Promicromonospora umidemergens]
MSTSTVQGRAVSGEPDPRRGTGARVARGLGAALLLIALVVGIPVGLWLLGGPLWTGPVSLDRVISVLTTPDVTGSVLIGLVKIVGWISWLTFAVAVLIEVVAALSGRRSPHVRGLGAQQRAASALVGAVITMLVAAPAVAPAMAATTPLETGATGTVVSAPVLPGAVTPGAVTPAGGAEKAGERAGADEAPSATYTVQPGDSLWRIAEQTLGDGARFKQIADLNYGVPQADGGALDAGNWIEPGWVLVLPAEASGTAVETGVSPTSTGQADDAEDDPGGSEGTVDVRKRGAAPEAAEVVVESGDTLWGIAEEELGDGNKFPEVFEASRDTEQPGGARLTDPDVILPGWTVTVPGAGESAPGARADGARADDAAQRPRGGDETSDRPSDKPSDGAADETDAPPGSTQEGSGEEKPDPAPSAEVTPEGAVEVEPEDIKEPGGAGNDVVEEDGPSAEQPHGEQPAGEAPPAEQPNRVGQNAGPKTPPADRDEAGQDAGQSGAGQDRSDQPDPADAGTGSAGIGGPETKEPAPEETAEGILVPEDPPAPRDTPAPQYDEVTPEDLRNQPDLEPDESTPQSPAPGDARPGDGLIADELMPEGWLDEPTADEPTPDETSSGSGTTWGGDLTPDRDAAVENGAEGLARGQVPLAPESDAAGTSAGGSVTEEVLPDELAGDEPVAEDGTPEVAVETFAPTEAPAPVDAPVDAPVEAGAPVEALAPVDVAGVTTAGPTATASAGAAATTAEDGASMLDAASDVVSEAVEDVDEAVGIRTAAGVGGLLAAGLIALVAVKRRRTRKGREPGQTVVVPGPDTPAGALERDLRAVEDPFGREQVDRALRSLAQWHRERGLPLPGVRVARLKSGEFVELYLEHAANLPEPWASTTDRFVWQLAAGDADAAVRVGAVTGSVAQPVGAGRETGLETDGEAPYPALVTVGHDDEDTHLMLDLENLACLDIRGTDAAAQATLAALAVELATSLWADDLQVTVVGALGELPGVVDTGRVRHVSSLAGIIRELEARAADVDRTLAQVGATSVADARGRGLATDAWTPEILLVGERLGLVERAKLEGLVDRVPGVGIAAVTSSAEVGEWVLDLTGELTNGDTSRGILMPAYIAVRPQQLDAATYAQALALLADPETAPGPSWSRSIDHTEPTLEEIPMDAVRAGAADSDVVVGEGSGPAPAPGYGTATAGGAPTTSEGRPGSFSPWTTAAVSVATPPLGTPVVPGPRVESGPQAKPVETSPVEQAKTVKPIVRVLGSVELAGTTGVELPSTHQRQATELIAFLAFNPGSRGSDISKALWPSREPNLATRRSAVSRARRWLGTDPGGYEYLPRYWSADDGGQADLESAGYRLRGVRTDWHSFCDLVGSDLAQTPTSDLLAALDLVRGRPFEGVPLRKYVWAEQLMHTISSGVVDVSHEVARRALLAGDVAMARHASQVGRLADPVDERSWRNGIRAEIASGRRDAVGRLVDRLRDHLEQLAMEPEPDTEELLAQVDEQDRRRGADAGRTPRG